MKFCKEHASLDSVVCGLFIQTILANANYSALPRWLNTNEAQQRIHYSVALNLDFLIELHYE